MRSCTDREARHLEMPELAPENTQLFGERAAGFLGFISLDVCKFPLAQACEECEI